MKPAPSQNEIILRILTRHRGRWVSLPRLANESGSLSPATRISNLREDGHRIENRTTHKIRNGRRVTKSMYRLLP